MGQSEAAEPDPPANAQGGWLANVRRKLAEVGPTYFARLLLQRVVPAWLWFANRGVVLELETGTAQEPALAGLRWGAASEPALLGAFGHSRAALAERFARGDRVCVLASGDRLDGYAWFHQGVYEEPELRSRFHMRPGEIWLYDAMVAPARRGEGLYPQLLAGAALRLAQLGIRRVLIFVDERNRNSLRAHVAGGAKPVAHLAASGLFGWVRIVDGRDGSARWLAPGRWYDTAAERGPRGG
jgi:GNAT superfamily N-acetyltransferase